MPNFIGQPLDRVDGRQKVMGQATYAAEHKIPNVARAVLLTATVAKGRIASIDTIAAGRVPGVIRVLTHLNTPKLPKVPQGQETARPTNRKLQLLQDDQVRYAGQPIAVVVAENLEAAQEAAGLVKVRYSSQAPQVNLENGIASSYVPKKAGGGGDPGQSNRGNVEAGLVQAAEKIVNIYSTPFEVHNPMEPHATIAVWDGPEHLMLYDATQGVFGDRERVATLLGLHPDNVHVISPFLGGGFGSKGPTWSHVVLCAIAAREVQRPVKIELRRPQMFGPVGFRSRTRQTVGAAAQADGTLTALTNDTVSQTSNFDEFTEAATVPTRMLYAVPNNATVQRLVKADIGTPSFMRAPGEAPGSYALEAAMDELAWALKIDPVELRLKNYAEQDPEKSRPWSSKSLRECYRIGAERFGWSKRKMETRSMRDGNTWIGWGMASSVYPSRRSESHAIARISQNGAVLVESGTQDLGTGTYTVMTQIAADAIGVNPAMVTFRLGDTDLPETPVSGGSQTAASTGSAVLLAGRALREKLVQAAITDQRSPAYGANTQDVLIDGGIISVRGKSNSEPLTVFMTRQARPIDAEAEAKPGEERDRYSMYAFGAQFAEVRVDADLGMIRVSRMLGVFGAGKILNAKTARSQLIGGMVFGIGMALEENAMLDERLGRFVNNNLSEYHVPVNADIPAIEALWVDEVDEHVNPLGVKGIGEIGVTGAAAAVANAVYHATGRRIRDLPITSDKLV